MKLLEFSKKLYNFHGCADSEGVKSLETLLSIAKDFFIKELKEVDENEFAVTHLTGVTGKQKKGTLMSHLVKFTNQINDVIKRAHHNDLGAIKELYGLFFDPNSHKPKKEANVKEIPAGSFFYRMRSAERHELFNRKGIFSLGQDMDSKVSKARFSKDGFPCLYLARTLYLAWEECRRPDFNMVNFALFKNTRKLKVMTVNIASTMMHYGEFVMSYLTLLCCAKSNDKDDFKYQYVVPNLLASVLCSNIQEKVKMKKGCEVDGIHYLSARRFECKDFLFQSRDVDDAYVFPPHSFPEEGVCSELSTMFRLTAPRTYFLYKVHRFSFSTATAKISDYNDSMFHALEEQLKLEMLETI